jgi:flagellar hook-associated protein 1 FlgK
MSSSGLMTIGIRAMFANTAALNVTGHNIANANVVGYSRQDVQLETAKGQFSGNGFYGKGVNVINVRRAHDDFLTMQAQAAKSLSAKDDARASQLTQLEQVFPPGNQGLGYAMGDFLGSMVDLSNSPSDPSARQVVLARASDVAARFKSGSDRINMLQEGVNSDLRNSAATVTTLAARVADLNQQIAGYHGLEQEPNDLLDQRDELIKQISGIVEVSTLKADDGTVGVFIAGGQRLVLGNEASKLTVKEDPADASRSVLALQSGGDTLTLREDMISGGSMAGLMKFQNDDLVDARNQLGQMAAAFVSKVNEAQSFGLDLRDPPDAGSPLFTQGAPMARPNANNAKDASGNFIAHAALTVTDASLLQASDYELTVDGSGMTGHYTLKRLSDGLTRNIVDGDSVDGFQINVGTPDLSANDRFLLQPVGQTAGGVTRALDDVDGIAAASPVTATMNVANTGTASVASLKVVSGGLDPSLSANISFTSGTGDYNWTLTDSGGTVVSSGSATWTAGQPISLNGFELNLNGVPASGDSVDVSKTQFPASNNGNAMAMAALRDERFVGRYMRNDGTVADGATVTDAYAATMADIGVRVQGSKASAQITAAAAAQTEQTLTSKTGVNLDEEASHLIQFQQAYQAAAKVLQVAQTVFDTMLQLGGR